MAKDITDIWVYAHWIGMETPRLIGVLSAKQTKGRKAFSFRYDPDWLGSREQLLLDSDLSWFTHAQSSVGKEHVGMFFDSNPDRWGRMLMEGWEIIRATESGGTRKRLSDIDYLLSIQDASRMGALRFKLDPEGPFLGDEAISSIPHMSSLEELQRAVQNLESGESYTTVKKWLEILLVPGSSLGGARPKANVRDEEGQIWIAKFPSQHDEIDKGAWEYLVHWLAIAAKIDMTESRLQKVSGKHHTFLTKRFDRVNHERIHFASAMAVIGHKEDRLMGETSSYLDLAEFIQFSGARVEEDLHQLWRRLVFNIAVSNTDDHLRNHGFLLTPEGWQLSPAFDINPSVDKGGLSLNITEEDNRQEIDLAREVGSFFQLRKKEMENIWAEVKAAVSNWKIIATEIGISDQEQERMASAFQF